MKIPTILALFILSLLTIGGLSARSYLSQFFAQQKIAAPQSITTSNLTPTSISISWFTTPESKTELIYTTDKNFLKSLQSASDERDQNKESRSFHFVTLLDLQPQTTYYFKTSNLVSEKSHQFTTPASNQSPDLKFSPVIGSVVNNNLQAISEALVTLSVPNYTSLSTYSSLSGNFVLPIKLIYNQNNPSQVLNLLEKGDVNILISKDNQTSQIDLNLNKMPNPLPPVILGQNLDLRDYQSTSSQSAQSSPTSQFNFDINGDGKINSIDLATVQANIGKKKFNPKADINLDGVVDQKDLDLLKQALPK